MDVYVLVWNTKHQDRYLRRCVEMLGLPIRLKRGPSASETNAYGQTALND